MDDNSRGRFSPDVMKMDTFINLEANWWVASDSSAPWRSDRSENEQGEYLTVYGTDEINGGDAFFVAMTFDHRLNKRRVR